MGLIKRVKKDGFDIIRMESLNDNIIMEINTTRGNIISSLIFENKEMIYIDKENYMSMERPKCGSPVLFPFLGRNQNNQLLIDGKIYSTDIHGIAHTNKWVVNNLNYDNNECSAEFYTTSNNLTKDSFPFDFRLDSKISLINNEIVYAMEITNLSLKTMPCDLGFHPFFTISHLNNLKFNVDADTIYNPDTKNRKKYNEIDNIELKNSGVILENCRHLKLEDEARNTCITICNRKELKNFMLWTGDEKKFIVIEPLTSIPNAINDKTNKFNLLSGESVESIWSFRLDTI